MTATQLQIRRDTAANIALSTPVSGEIWYDTTNKRLNVGDGSRVGGFQIPNFSDIQNGSFDYALATGTANALVVTTTPTNPSAYATGQKIRVKIATTNTGSATINWGALGVKTIRKWSSGTLIDLVANDLVAGMILDFYYDGTYFVLSAASGGQNTRLIATTTISGSPQTIDFVDIFVANKDYEIVFNNVIPNGNSHLNVLLAASGSSFFTSSYSYAAQSSTNDLNSSGSAASIQLTGAQIDSSVVSGFSGSIFVYNPNSSAGYKKIVSQIGHTKSGSGVIVSEHASGAYIANANAIRSIRIDLDATNTFNSGTISLYERDFI